MKNITVIIAYHGSKPFRLQIDHDYSFKNVIKRMIGRTSTGALVLTPTGINVLGEQDSSFPAAALLDSTLPEVRVMSIYNACWSIGHLACVYCATANDRGNHALLISQVDLVVDAFQPVSVPTLSSRLAE